MALDQFSRNLCPLESQPNIDFGTLTPLCRKSDRVSIPSLASFVSVESDRTMGFPTCRSSPSLTPTIPNLSENQCQQLFGGSCSDNGRETKTADSGAPWASKEGRSDVAVNEDDELSDVSALFSLSLSNGIPPQISSSNDSSFEADLDFKSLANLSNTDKRYCPNAEDVENRKRKGNQKRKISNWYQESLVKSYRAKVNQFKKIFKDSPVDTDRLLVDYSCALAKNKNGLLLQGRMYITEQWICFYSKIIYEQKLHLAVKDVQSVTKAKTARVIPNAIQLKVNSERYFFTSFASRERTFAILKKISDNSKVGSRLLPPESEVANMEDLLCQVQDVYGDESLAVLDFEEGDDFEDEEEDDMFPNHLGRSSGASSSSELLDLGAPSPSQGTPTHSSSFQSATIPSALVSIARGSPTDSPNVPRHPRARSQHHWRGCYEEKLVAMERSFSSGEVSECDTTTTDEGPTDGLKKVCSKSQKRQDRTNDGTSVSLTSAPPINCIAVAAPPSRKKDVAPRPPLQEVKAPSQPTSEEQDDDDDNEAVFCGDGHEHRGHMYANTAVNLSVDALFACLFTDSHFFADFCAHRATFDVKQSHWPPQPWITTDENADYNLHRTISYTLTLKQRLVARTCTAVENQTVILRETVPGKRYVVDAKVTNEAVPLCNYFHVTSRYCLLRRSAKVSHLKIYSEVVYDRQAFFGAKSIIERTCMDSLKDNFTDLVNHLAAAVMRLPEEDKVTGGALARLFRPQGEPSHSANLGIAAPASFSPSLELDGTTGGPHLEGVDEWQRSKGGQRTRLSSQPRGFDIRQTNDQDYDKNWFLRIAMSILGLVCLSMVYNRYHHLERRTGQHIDLDGGQFGDSHTGCPDEIQSVRMLIKSISTVLNQMQKAVQLLDERLDKIASDSCVSPSRVPFWGQ